MPETTERAIHANWHFQTWLRIASSTKPKVYKQVFETTEMGSLSYWLEIFFSAGIATFGLVQNSPAVIIGAMLISPLMGPILSTGLAIAVGDLYMGIRAVVKLAVSVAVSIAFSGFLVWILPFHSATGEIIARTNPNLLDLGIALLSGLAGSVVLCRAVGDGATALPGVAIAVALMPPVCVVGFGLGSGVNLEIMAGAGLLFLTNLVAIVASAFLIFLLVGMNTAEVHQAMLASSGSGWFRRIISPVAGSSVAGAPGGRLRWRILMLLMVLASIAVPLRRALLQVASETIARSAVQDNLRRLAPAGGVVSQQVTVGPSEIVIRLISTAAIPEAKITDVRQDLMRRTGRAVQLSVDTVASKSELADLMQRLDQPVAAIPKEKTLIEMQKELIERVRPALLDIWPSTDAPIENFGVLLRSTGMDVEVQYQSLKDLGSVPENMVQQSLRGKLQLPDLTLKTRRVRPPRPGEKRKAVPVTAQ